MKRMKQSVAFLVLFGILSTTTPAMSMESEALRGARHCHNQIAELFKGSVEIYKDVVDLNTALAAVPKLKNIRDKYKAIDRQLKIAEAKLTKDEKSNIRAEFFGTIIEIIRKLTAEKNRIESLPGELLEIMRIAE